METKFRIWNGVNFIYQENINWIDFRNKCASIFNAYSEDCSEIIDVSNVISQYIGLKDSSNKEIYEGDIISSGGFNWLVQPINSFSEKEGCYIQMVNCLNGGELFPIDKSILKGRVIGSIYDNIDLFE